jgi:diadenosine tetraphosphate (Ap4A) HIT family hydrolase
MFELHPRLAQDCLALGHFPLCRLLLMNERRYPWFVLVPQRPAIREIYQLEPADQRQLLDESCALARALDQLFQPDKLNIAAIGNLVPQLHLHHVARFKDDPAWPNPVWGRFEPLPYAPTETAGLRARLAEAGLGGFVAAP